MRGRFQYPVRRQRAMGDVPVDPSTGTPVFAPGEVAHRSPIEPGPRDWYTYLASFPEIDTLTNATVNVPIEADSNFWLTSIQYFTAITSLAAPGAETESSFVLPFLSILITDSGSGRNLMSAPIPLPALLGDGKRPHRLIHPRLFKRTTNITVALTNYGSVNYFYTNIVLEGFKVYGNAPVG